MVITGLVVAIAIYHYVRFVNSWNAAFNVTNEGTKIRKKDCTVSLSGEPFNAYPYVDWLLTVPLLLFELICVMDLPAGSSLDLTDSSEASFYSCATFLSVLCHVTMESPVRLCEPSHKSGVTELQLLSFTSVCGLLALLCLVDVLVCSLCFDICLCVDEWCA